MIEKIGTAYELPFEVRCTPGHVFSSGGDVSVVVSFLPGPPPDLNLIAEILGAFAGLGMTGAFAGAEIEPWNSELRLGEASGSLRLTNKFDFSFCMADEWALSVLTQLFTAKRAALSLKSLEISAAGREATVKLRHIPDLSSTLPPVFARIPFLLIDEEPESGGYTFTAELQSPVLPKHQEYLEGALKFWTMVVRRGGYEMAPIPPEESFVELFVDRVIVFGATVEWTILKLRADPDCINGVVNIFAAFHYRCQPLISLSIS